VTEIHLILEPIFLQCFDTVGWVIWPIKSRPRHDYNVFCGMLNLTLSVINVLCHVWYVLWQALCCSLSQTQSSSADGQSRHSAQVTSIVIDWLIDLVCYKCRPWHITFTFTFGEDSMLMVGCLEVRGAIIRTVLCCIVYWSCAQS